MNARRKMTDELDQETDVNDSDKQEFSELDTDIPKRAPMRRKDRQREGVVEKKRKGNEKRKNARLKYQFEE
jgi:hypothetical protein